MAHFVPANAPFTCRECDEEQKADALVMHVTKREPKGAIGSFSRTTVPLCYDCGVLYLESQDHPIERRHHRSAPPVDTPPTPGK